MSVKIIGLAILVIAVIIIVSKKNAVAGKVLVLLSVGALLAFGVLIASLMLAFSTVDAPFYSTILVILALIVMISLGASLWGVLKKKAVYIPVCVCVGICLISTFGYCSYKAYHNNIPKFSESDNLLYDYTPYNDMGMVAELNEESTLKLTEKLPKMDGATALYPVYSAFARAVYPSEVITETKDKPYSEYITCTTTTNAYYKIVTGEADVVFVAGPSDEQKKFAEENGVELEYTPIGKEAFVFFVNAENPLNDITVEQVREIYSGEITNWNELGVNNLGKIKAFQRDEGSGSQSALLRLMADKKLMSPPKEDVIGGMGGIITKTADYRNYKNAIGYSFRFYSTQMVKNKQIKLLSINGVYPDITNVENGTYPISSYFYAVTRKDASENVKKLVNWITDKQGQKLIELTGYTPL